MADGAIVLPRSASQPWPAAAAAATTTMSPLAPPTRRRSRHHLQCRRHQRNLLLHRSQPHRPTERRPERHLRSLWQYQRRRRFLRPTLRKPKRLLRRSPLFFRHPRYRAPHRCRLFGMLRLRLLRWRRVLLRLRTRLRHRPLQQRQDRLLLMRYLIRSTLHQQPLQHRARKRSQARERHRRLEHL